MNKTIDLKEITAKGQYVRDLTDMLRGNKKKKTSNDSLWTWKWTRRYAAVGKPVPGKPVAR